MARCGRWVGDSRSPNGEKEQPLKRRRRTRCCGDGSDGKNRSVSREPPAKSGKRKRRRVQSPSRSRSRVKAEVSKQPDEGSRPRRKRRVKRLRVVDRPKSASPPLILKPRRDASAAKLAPKPRRRVHMVGIAGPSGSGKSTLAKSLAAKLGSPVLPIGMDWFLQPKWMPKDPKWGKNWETPEGVDFRRLCEDLKHCVEVLEEAECMPEKLEAGGENIVYEAGSTLQSDDVFLFVEGFLLFCDRELCDMFGAHIWVEADCDTCMLRRHKRGKQSRKRPVEESADWFRGLVWVHHEKNRRSQLRNAHDALRLDGSDSKKELLHRAMEHCRSLQR